MTIQKVWILLLICFGQITSALSQTPFDLHHRLSEKELVSQRITEDTLAEREFSIERDSLERKSDIASLKDTSSVAQAAPSDLEKISSEDQPTNDITDPASSPMNQQRKRNLIFGTFILLVLYLTVVISFRRSVVNEIFRSILNDNYLNLLLRKLRSRGLSQFVFLYFFSIINGGLFLFLVSEKTDYFSLKVNLLTISSLIAAIYLIRHLTFWLLASIFPLEKPVYQFSFTILIFNLFLGLILFPVNLFIAFSPAILTIYFIYFALISIGLFYILRQLRGLFIAAPWLSQYKFHFLLYLCTIEIAPLAVLYKFFHPYFS